MAEYHKPATLKAEGTAVYFDECAGETVPQADVPIVACCTAFADAQRDGTDSEGFGKLIWENDDGTFDAGTNLLPIAFCPWCGKRTRPEITKREPTVRFDPVECANDVARRRGLPLLTPAEEQSLREQYRKACGSDER